MISSPKPCTKPSATRFLHQLQGTLQQANRAQSIHSLQTIFQKLQTLKSKLTKGMHKKQQFQDLIQKCQTLVKQKLRSARIKGKYSPPLSGGLKKAKSQQEFRMNSKDIEISREQRRGNKRNYNDDQTREQYRHTENEQECKEWSDKLLDIRKQIKKEKQEKSKLINKVNELQQDNKIKGAQLDDLRSNMTKLNNKVEKIQNKKDIKQKLDTNGSQQHPPYSPKSNLNTSHSHVYTNSQELKLPPRSPQHKIYPNYPVLHPHSHSLSQPQAVPFNNSSIKSLHNSHNLYTLQKQNLIRQFQQRINQKNSIILQLQHHIATIELQNSQLKANSVIKSTQITESVQSLKIMLKSSNEKLELAIKQKLDLKEIIKQLQVKNEVFAAEIEKLIREGNRWRQEIEKKDKIMEHKIYEEKRNKELDRRRVYDRDRDVEIQSDKVMLFQRLDLKDKEISLLKQDLLKVKHDIDLMSMALRVKQDKIIELQQLNYKRNLERDVEINVKRVELARTKSEQFNNTLKNTNLREQAKRTQANVNKSLDMTRKLNALEGIRNIIRRFPHGQ